jgi:hypothetical protein
MTVAFERVAHALERREAEWPTRGPAAAEFRAEAEALGRLLLREVEAGRYPIDTDAPDRTGVLAEHPVFICGCMKSGTTLLCQLLDGHPDLVVMPGDSHAANHMTGPLGAVTGPGAMDRLAAHWVARMINPTAQPPYWLLGGEPRRYGEFVAWLRHVVGATPEFPARGFLAAARAWCAVEPALAAARVLVEKTPDNEHKIGAILGAFPAARFIHILRDPLPVIAALKRLYALRSWAWSLDEVCSMARRSAAAAAWNSRRLGADRYLTVRYEDLVAAPREQMGRVAAFLGVPWHDTLLQPTTTGRAAASNSMFAERRATGALVAESPADAEARARAEFTPDELAVLRVRIRTGRRAGRR